jgi:hypothetical protein
MRQARGTRQEVSVLSRPDPRGGVRDGTISVMPQWFLVVERGGFWFSYANGWLAMAYSQEVI